MDNKTSNETQAEVTEVSVKVQDKKHTQSMEMPGKDSQLSDSVPAPIPT